MHRFPVLLAGMLVLCCMSASGAVITLTTASGWQQSLDGGTTWTPAQATSMTYFPGGQSMSALWPLGVGDGTPVLFRLSFPLSGTPVSGTLWVAQDDDGTFKVNGAMVLVDGDYVANDYGPFDITPYLQSGNNLFEASVYSTFCCVRGFAAYAVIETREGDVVVPEPSTVGLMVGGLAVFAWFGRRLILAG